MAAPQQVFFMAGTTTAYAAKINAGSYFRYAGSPCGIQFRADGTVWVKESGAYVFQYYWRIGAGSGSDYEIRNTLDSGSPASFSTGTMATWQALSTDREWTRSSTGWADRIATGTFEIREAVSHTVLATNTITLECEYGTGVPP